ncbi:hypothetical protein [Streptomyces sp. NPDC088707]|uniref:hypothetical protein n=1 Tax=Streptomyces sp. NPDC088707 TaxID=3365871 RepID=UPI003807B66C
MTNPRKTTTTAETTADTAPTATDDTATAPATAVAGPPLREGQSPEKVVLAHHLVIGGRDYRPGESVHVSPDYARQLRGNGYIARGRG